MSKPYVQFDGRTWPNPGYTLKKSQFSYAQAVSIANAYEILVFMPRRRREQLIRGLRKAATKAKAEP